MFLMTTLYFEDIKIEKIVLYNHATKQGYFSHFWCTKFGRKVAPEECLKTKQDTKTF